MATNIVLLQLAVMLVTMTTTFAAVKQFKLKKIGGQTRSRGYASPQLSTVLGRIDKLASSMNDLQTTLNDMSETLKVINATLDPHVVS